MDKFRYERRRIGKNPGRVTQSEDLNFPDKYLKTRAGWKEAIDNLINKIEGERAKIGPLTRSDLTDDQVIDSTRKLEQLINDYLLLKSAGRFRGYDEDPWL
mgnify:CR=1 FL=1